MQASKVRHITAAVRTVREKNGERHEKASKNMLRLKKIIQTTSKSITRSKESGWTTYQSVPAAAETYRFM